MSNILILAIETSCDETAISIVRAADNDSLHVLSSEVSSQVKLHAQWGGVVPNLAAREHVKNITPILKLSLENAGVSLNDITAIAVTSGPGLIPALMVGVNFAKTLAYLWEKPLIGIHHIEGHIYANFISQNIEHGTWNKNAQIQSAKNQKLPTKNYPNFPILCLVVSGGHTQLVYMEDDLQYEIIGQTLDDAVGEAFDKVARILSIGYPGGPMVAKYAANYKPKTNNYKPIFPRPMLNKNNFNFSFSGLKTAVLYETKKHPELLQDKQYIAAVCHEFQQASVDVLVTKTLRAAKQYAPKTILLAGGVSANKELREQLGLAIKSDMPDVSYSVPDFKLTGDNAAMIAAAAVIRWRKMSDSQKKKTLDSWKTLQPDANLKLR